MAEHDDDSFKDMNLKEKVMTVIGIGLLLVLIIGFILGMFFLGFAGLFELLGVHYQSNWSLVLFVVGVFFVGMVVEIFFDAFLERIIEHITSRVEAFFMQFLFEYASDFLTLVIVDTWMDSITLSLKTKVIVALFLALFGTIFDNKKEKIDERK